MGDRWFTQFKPDGEGRERLEEMREMARGYGRDPADNGVEGRVAPVGEHHVRRVEWPRSAHRGHPPVQYRNGLQCDAWEMVIPELVFEPDSWSGLPVSRHNAATLFCTGIVM